MSDLGQHGAAFGARAAAAAMQASGSTTYAPPALPATWKHALEATSVHTREPSSNKPKSSAPRSTRSVQNRPLFAGATLPPLPSPPPKTSLATQAKRGVGRVVQSKLLTALMVFLFTMVALLLANPPMARDPHDPRQRSWKKMVIWSSLAFASALALPWCFPTAQIVI